MLNVQTILTDALLKVGAMSPQDAGNPDPELQAIALRELNMLLSDLGISLNQSRRTSVIIPKMRDRIIFGDVQNTALASTLPFTVPTAAPYQIQLQGTNVQSATVEYIDDKQPLTVDWQVAPAAAGTVYIEQSTGIATFNAADAGRVVTVSLTFAQSSGMHADLVETPSDIISLQFELGNLVYPCARISYAEYQALSLKQQVQTFPTFYAYDFQFPNPTLWVYPMALDGMTARIVWSRFFLAAEDGSELDAPDYMYKYLVYNLATQLYTTFPTANGIDPELVMHAKLAASHVKDYLRRQSMPKVRGDYRKRGGQNILLAPYGPMFAVTGK